MNTRKSSNILESKVSKKKVGNATQTTIRLNKKDKSNISSANIVQMIAKFQKNGNQISVRGLNTERFMTLKTLAGDYNPDGLDEYYRNKVSEEDVIKFTSFSQVHLTIFS